MDPQMEIAIQRASEEAANKVAREVLLKLGVDAREPLEVQKDMAALRELRSLLTDPEFQRDMVHLRKWRKAVNAVETKGTLTIVGLVVAGICGAVFLGVKEILAK